jgi:hypothetical protein
VVPAGSVSPPTAVQTVFDGHDTPSSELLPAPAGAIGWIVHVVPFQRSASITSMPVTSLKNPTAVQNPDEVHETPASCTELAAAGVGVRWIDHRVALQRSASVTPAPARLMKSPTAVQ